MRPVARSVFSSATDLCRALALSRNSRDKFQQITQQFFKLSAIYIIFSVRRPVEDLLGRHQRPEFIDHIVRFDAHCADSTPSGHSAHQHPDTRSTLIRTGSRSAATQVCIVSLKPLPPSISLRACASIRPSVRSDKRCAPDGRGSRRPRSDRRSAHAICPPASGW